MLTGHGLVSHRVISTICEMMGIRDIHAKVEGSTKNVKAITKGFFNALIHQVSSRVRKGFVNAIILQMRSASQLTKGYFSALIQVS